MKPEAEAELVTWFRDLFAARTGTNNPLDFDPRYRVTWSEVYGRMRELGCTLGLVDARQLWLKIKKRNGIKDGLTESDPWNP